MPTRNPYLRLSLACALPLAAQTPAPSTRTPPAPTSTPAKPTPSATVEVTAPLPTIPLQVDSDPKLPRQPVPAHDGADFLKTIPGFAVIRKGGTDGDPVFRGLGGSRLLMLLDGEQLLGGCGGRMDPPTAYIYPESYDRIRVTKGPQTVLTGPGQVAGSVAFERTHDALAHTGLEGFASLLGGSAGRSDQVLDVRGGTSTFDVRGTGTRAHSDDYQDGRGTTVHSRYTRWSTGLVMGWSPTEDVRFEGSGSRSNGQAAYADRSVDGSKFLRENLGFRATVRRLGPWVEKLECQVYRNYVDHIMDNYSLRPFSPGMMSPEPAAMNPDRTTTGGRLALDFRLHPDTLLVAGFDTQSNVHTGRMSMMQWSMPEEAMPRVADARFRNTGLFAELSQALSREDRLVAGLRADRWRAEDPRQTIALTMMSTAPNPTAGQTRLETLTSGFLRYEHGVATGSTFYAGVGRAARFPDYWETIPRESLTSVSAFGIRPECNNQLDLGWIQQAGPIQTSVSAYLGRVDDFILIQSEVEKPAGMMGTRKTSVSRNVDATTWGGEVAATAALAPHWKLDASLAYARGQNTTDRLPLAQVPPLESRLSLGWETEAWSAALLLRAVAHQERIARNQGNIAGQDLGPTAGFGVLSLNGGWKPAAGWRVTAGVDNLFNRTYAEHLSRTSSAVPGYALQSLKVNEPGRTLWLKGSFTFGR